MKYVYVIFLFIFISHSSHSKIVIDKISPNLSNLWGISILNKEEILFTQRSGKVYRLNIFKKKLFEITGAPEVFNSGQGGLLDIEIEQKNKRIKVYLCFSKKLNKSQSATAVNSYDLINDELKNKKSLFVSNKTSSSSRHFGCRLAIKNDHIYATIGDRAVSYTHLTLPTILLV